MKDVDDIITKPLRGDTFSDTCYGYISNDTWLLIEKDRIERGTGKELEIVDVIFKGGKRKLLKYKRDSKGNHVLLISK